MKKFKIAIAGNPNCGKTALFNVLTGARQQVGNWPGVTVERLSGHYVHKNISFEVTDLPGIYSFSAYSLDEVISRKHILLDRPDLVINILDASNLERNLYLTTQLLEMQVPMLVVLNMMDKAEQLGVGIELEHLAQHLDCPVIPIVATRKKGISELLDQINHAVNNPTIPSTRITYDSEIEKVIQTISCYIESTAIERKVPARWAALKLLEHDQWASEYLDAGPEVLEKASHQIQHAERHVGEDIDLIVADGRYGFIHGLAADVIARKPTKGSNITENIDRIVLNRVLGIPFFFFVMYLVFSITINVGGPFIDFFDQLCGTIFVDGTAHLLAQINTPPWIAALLSDGVGGGIQTLSTFIPPIFFIFLCLSFLEDSGYMARAAFVMDRFLRAIGLPGKAFIPMLVGFGCNVPGIMSTRTLENERDRTLAILINPFMSCGARLPVYTLFAAVFFPQNGGLIIFTIYMIGIVLAILSGLLFRNILLKGEVSTFVMELPHYHLPTLNGILYHTWTRLKDFIWRAGQVILLVVIILGGLNSIGTDGRVGIPTNSILSALSRKVTPVFHPMGIRSDNWPATVGIFSGVFAKEAVVGTLETLYATMDTEADPSDTSDATYAPLEGIKAAFAAIPAGFKGLGSALLDPLGLGGALKEIDTQASHEDSTFFQRFGSRTAAFSYLLFILIYTPCVAVIAAIARETSRKWAIFSVTYLTMLAWCIATLFFQVATLTQHPLSSGLWVLLCLIIMGGAITAMSHYAKKRS